MKKLLMITMMITAFCFGFFGRTSMNAHAEEETLPEKDRYYTSIQIRQGDNLWSVANRYAEGSGFTTQEYMDELKRMNGLNSEKIHSGEYLTIVYVSD